MTTRSEIEELLRSLSPRQGMTADERETLIALHAGILATFASISPRRTSGRLFRRVGTKATVQGLDRLLKNLHRAPEYLATDPLHAPAIKVLADYGVMRHHIAEAPELLRPRIEAARKSLRKPRGGPPPISDEAENRGSPRDRLAEIVITCAQRAYWELSGRSPGRSVK